VKYPSWLPILLGFLTAIGPISTDMYLPAFPAIESSLGLPIGSAQVTLATWFLGLAVGQITQGSLADRFGRRVPLIVGTAVYALAAAGCALSHDLLTLSVFRFIAAVGGSASMVIPRAIVRDLAEGHAAARLMSRLILVSGAAPILAPSLGGLLLQVASWPMIFWCGAIYGAVCFVLVWAFLPDTLPPERQVRLGMGRLLMRYGDIVRERGFITHTLMGGMGMFGMFAYIGGSPEVLIDKFHLSPSLYAVVFSACAANFILCSQINPFLLPRVGSERVSWAAGLTFLVAALALAAVAFLQVPLWWAIIPPIMVCLGCQGFNMPNSTVGALQRHAAHAGSASALMGTIQFCLAAVSGLLVGELADGTARPLAALMVIGGVGVVVASLFRPKPVVVGSQS
jgi:DHA1 family bicyclomycin/chloramphenicol resistance-like MFS transporter